MHEDIAEFCLKKTQELGCKYVEVRTEKRTSSGFVLKSGNPEITGFDITKGIGIRYLVNNNLGFLSTNNFDKDKILSLMKKSIATTKNSNKISKKIFFSEEKPQKANYKEIHKHLIKIPQRYLTIGDEVAEKYYINSEGSKISSVIPRISMLYFFTLSQDKKSIQRYLQYGACSGYEIINKWDLIKKIPEDVELLRNNMNDGIKSPKGKMDLVVCSEISGIAVHESVGHPYEADRILGREGAQAGESFVTP